MKSQASGATSRLAEPRQRLRDLEVAIRQCKSEQALVQQEAARERILARIERELARASFTDAVMVRWDQGMSVGDIAKVLKCTRPAVVRVIAKFRRIERVTIRRGRLPRRRDF